MYSGENLSTCYINVLFQRNSINNYFTQSLLSGNGGRRVRGGGGGGVQHPPSAHVVLFLAWLERSVMYEEWFLDWGAAKKKVFTSKLLPFQHTLQSLCLFIKNCRGPWASAGNIPGVLHPWVPGAKFNPAFHVHFIFITCLKYIQGDTNMKWNAYQITM